MNTSGSKILNFAIIIIIFSLTGLTSVYVSGFIMQSLNFEKWSAGYILGIIFIVTPIYQILLLMYAALFGKFTYFLDKQKKLFHLILKLFNPEKR